MNDDTEDPGRIKLPNHTHPSDYLDVQPRAYNPEFISQISSKMQVPHRISVRPELDGKELPAETQFVEMTVPDRIVLAGENHHIALRQELDLDLPGTSVSADSLSYVGLTTPPRTITLEERFPVVEETDDQKMMAARGGNPDVGHRTSNGHIGGFTDPYDPGVNLHGPVLINEENEAKLLRTQVSRLTRRVQVIEEESQRRAHKELILYPLILGYLLLTVLGWLNRNR